MRTEPAATRHLLEIVTEFIVDWLRLPKDHFPTIGGILILDELMNFIGPEDSEQFALLYGKRLFRPLDISVRFLRNDAFGPVTANYLGSDER